MVHSGIFSMGTAECGEYIKKKEKLHSETLEENQKEFGDAQEGEGVKSEWPKA